MQPARVRTQEVRQQRLAARLGHDDGVGCPGDAERSEYADADADWLWQRLRQVKIGDDVKQ
jgi:hypothetical protein